jgi:hypothetical protein
MNNAHADHILSTCDDPDHRHLHYPPSTVFHFVHLQLQMQVSSLKVGLWCGLGGEVELMDQRLHRAFHCFPRVSLGVISARENTLTLLHQCPR